MYLRNVISTPILKTKLHICKACTKLHVVLGSNILQKSSTVKYSNNHWFRWDKTFDIATRCATDKHGNNGIINLFLVRISTAIR